MERKVRLYIGNAAKYKPENYYELDDYTVNDSGDVFDSTGQKLKEFMRAGYKYVRLNIDGKERLCKVHRIVATTFKDICGEFNEVVNHLDENKENNSAINLRWTTNEDNLSWGTIKERARESVAKNTEIKNALEKFYRENNIPVPPRSFIRLKKTRARYIIHDELNGITLRTQGFEPIIICSRNVLKKYKQEVVKYEIVKEKPKEAEKPKKPEKPKKKEKRYTYRVSKKDEYRNYLSDFQHVLYLYNKFGI